MKKQNHKVGFGFVEVGRWVQETSRDGSELGFNSDKSRYFYWGELRVQFTGKPEGQRSHREQWSRKGSWGAPTSMGAEEMPETEKSEKEQKDTTPPPWVGEVPRGGTFNHVL